MLGAEPAAEAACGAEHISHTAEQEFWFIFLHSSVLCSPPSLTLVCVFPFFSCLIVLSLFSGDWGKL